MKISGKQRKAIFAKTAGHCAYCGVELPKGWHVDHVEPLFRNTSYSGGKAVFSGMCDREQNHNIDNMLPSCRQCNNFKAAMNLEQFRKELQGQVAKAMKYSVNFRMAMKFGQLEITAKPIVFHFEEGRKDA